MKSRKSTPVSLAQGDILFLRVDGVPSEARSVAPVGNRFVLAEGEATGHAHTVPARGTALMEVPNEGGVTYLTVEELTGGVEVSHQEHASVKLDPGTWKVIRQREYTDDDENWSLVAD